MSSHRNDGGHRCDRTARVHQEGGSPPARTVERCGSCSGCRMQLGPRGRFQVEGGDARQVIAVMQEVERERLAARGPWRAGLFYLLCLAVITAAFLAAAHVVQPVVLPFVLVAALSGVLVLGALQQRQDGRISERGLLGLVSAALRTARTVGRVDAPVNRSQ